MELLEFIVTIDGLKMDSKKKEAIIIQEVPKMVRDELCFLQFANNRNKRLDNNKDIKNNINLKVDNLQTSNMLMSCQEERIIHSYLRKDKALIL
jgi:hypothetical protein